ncbi:hypothetical protein ACEQPO_16615 [Bacillus sp. SL00103]
MSIEEAVSPHTSSDHHDEKGGETFIQDGVVQLADLLKAFQEYADQINVASPEILVVGKRPEKSFTKMAISHGSRCNYLRTILCHFARPKRHPAFKKVDFN